MAEAAIDTIARGLAARANTGVANVTSLRNLKGPMRALFIGDSLFYGDNDRQFNDYGALSIASQICWRSGGRIVMRSNIAVPGYTTTQLVPIIADDGLLMPGLDIVFVLQGTNDLIQGASQATTLLNDKMAIRAIHSRGLRCVMLAIPPNNTSGSGANSLNTAKRANALAEGAIWIDPWTAARAGDGTFVSGASPDGVHPRQAYTALGAAAVLADPVLAPLLPSYGVGSTLLTGDLSNPIPTPDFRATYNSGGSIIPLSWNAYGVGQTGTWTVAVADDAGSGGRLATITGAAGAAGAYYLQSTDFSLAVHRTRRVAFSGRLKTSGVQANSGAKVMVRLVGNNDTNEGGVLRVTPLTGLTTDGDGWFYGECQVPSGATTAMVLFGIYEAVSGGAMSASISDCTIRPVEFEGLDIRSRAKPVSQRHVSSSVTLGLDDRVTYVNATAGPVTITLPSPTYGLYGFGAYSSAYQRLVPSSGLTYTVIKIDNSANAVTVTRAGSATIEGATSVSLAAQWDKVKLLAAKANLFVKVG